MSIKVDQKELNNIYDKFVKSKDIKANITVEFDNVNNVDPIVLIRVMGDAPDAAALAPVVETMLDGHTIKFFYGDKTIKSISYNRGSGNSLHLMFDDAPYLYDLLQQTAYALLLKKLTPDLEGSA